MVREEFKGKGKAQASGGGVFACAKKEQGKDERFGVLGGSAAAFGEGMLLAEALHPGVDVLDGQGSEGRLGWVSPFHQIGDT